MDRGMRAVARSIGIAAVYGVKSAVRLPVFLNAVDIEEA
jgi:hypothetical protein